MKRFPAPLVLGLFAAAALAAPAVADPSGVGAIERTSRTVHLADVDLHTIDGAKEAASRIKHAADYVCGGDWLEMHMSSDFSSCRRDAIDRALASLDAPLVSAALGRRTLTDVASR